jgi:hypothetical protein
VLEFRHHTHHKGLKMNKVLLSVAAGLLLTMSAQGVETSTQLKQQLMKQDKSGSGQGKMQMEYKHEHKYQGENSKNPDGAGGGQGGKSSANKSSANKSMGGGSRRK